MESKDSDLRQINFAITLLVVALFVLDEAHWSAVLAAEKKAPTHSSDKAATSQRSIQFPDTWSMGTLSITQTKNGQEVSSRLGKAQGLVKVPQDARLELSLNDEATERMSSLDLLKPDDIQLLAFRPGMDTESVDLGPIRHLSGLKELNLAKLQDALTDTALAKLKGLNSLRSLNLSDSSVTDKGMALVAAQFPQLETLTLNHDRITDSGLTELTKLKSLKTLELRHTQISDAGLKTIAKIVSLTKLTLDETKITDAGLTYLQSMPALEVLWLSRDHVTKNSVKALLHLPRLKLVNLMETDMDKESALSLVKRFGPHSVMWFPKELLQSEKVRQLRETGE
jgi:hypothetical protein